MSKMMKSIQISNKFYNLSILLLAKEEHKRKFNDYSFIGSGMRGLKTDILQISILQKYFMLNLNDVMIKKYEKYITERKIIIPKFDDITEYNCETDCPVCFETIGDNTNGCMEGDNCNHTICSNCRDKIVIDTNKCPICREKLDDNHTGTETDDDDETETQNTEETDEDDYGFGNDNQRPTERLFVGRRWFNTETNIIEYYNGSSWTTRFVRFDTMFRFLMRNMGFSNDGLLEDCCQSCGIQRTTEVNDFMNDSMILMANNYFYYGECYTCQFIYRNLENHFNNMPYPYSSFDTTSYDTASLHPH
jgi:hypothetical protein